MATYKVWLTVKDRYGSIKKVDGGNIDVGLAQLTEDEINSIDSIFATDTALDTAIKDGTDTIKYAGFEFNESFNSN